VKEVRKFAALTPLVALVAIGIGCGDEDGETTVIREQAPEVETVTVPQQAPSEAQAPAPAPPAADAAPAEVPDVVGERLDVARREVQGAGFRARPVGGGVFGVVVEENWTVCAQEPGGGSSADAGAKVDLTVDRSC